MKKKFMCIIGLMLAMALVCSLIGCSGGDVTSSSNPAESTVQTSIPTEATIPGESEPAETGTAAPSPSEAETVMTEVPETKPTETEAIPSETKPAETEPAPVETKPAETEAAPVETKPVETEPVPTEAVSTEVTPTETEHKHKYSASKTVAPTCTDQGYTVYKCSCGDSYKGDKKDATGHSWGEWTVTKEATTEAEGSKERTCSACGEVQTKTIDKVVKELELSDPATEFEMEIAKAIFKYINQFRKEEGTPELIWLDGMSQVAEYRSRQLVTNMAHDGHDIREAHAYYKYGEYIDMTQYGYDKSYSYWEGHDGEAIAAGLGYGNKYTADEMGNRQAISCRKSEGHWRYVGSSEYSYCGIGTTWVDGDLYVCIMVGTINYG